MLATFCLRLAIGLAASLLVISPKQVAPRFYRTQFLTILGLVAGAGVVLYLAGRVDLGQVTYLAFALFLAFVGSVIWMLEGAPGGRTVIVLTLFMLIGAIIMMEPSVADGPAHASRAWLLVEDLTSAALLGAATSAMLMGHSYLVAPAMSIVPLLHLLIALAVAAGVRMIVAGIDLGTGGSMGSGAVTDTLLWLPVRWGVGFVGPLVLGWMAWQCARIRSTQSATGILYVVVILCFLGELTGQLLHG